MSRRQKKPNLKTFVGYPAQKERDTQASFFGLLVFIFIFFGLMMWADGCMEKDEMRDQEQNQQEESVNKTSLPVAPTEEPEVLAEGLASHYGYESCTNSACKQANGKVLNENAMTCAVPQTWIRSGIVEFGDKLKVSSGSKSIVVEITDTGSFYLPKYNRSGKPRVIDLTHGAYQKIAKGGLVDVKVEKL